MIEPALSEAKTSATNARATRSDGVEARARFLLGEFPLRHLTPVAPLPEEASAPTPVAAAV